MVDTIFKVDFNLTEARNNSISDRIEFRNDTRRKAIALVTLYRSGSTFVGELFNQNLGSVFHLTQIHGTVPVNFVFC